MIHEIHESCDGSAALPYTMTSFHVNEKDAAIHFHGIQRDCAVILVAKLRPAERRRGRRQWRAGDLAHRSAGED